MHALAQEVNPNGSLVVLVEVVVHESRYYGRFADGLIA
jgi:hypothetical protein